MNLATLRTQCLGDVLTPADAQYHRHAQSWNTAVTVHPAVIVVAHRVEDIQAALQFAQQAQLHVAVQSTGHDATPIAGAYLLDAVASVPTPSE